MSPSAESLRHYLFKIETNKQDPEIVDEKHSEPVTNCPVVILSEQVFRFRANLTCFKLWHYSNGLDHGHRWGKTGPEAVIKPGILVCNEVLEHGWSEVDDWWSDCGSASFREQTLSDHNQTKQGLAVEPNNSEDYPTIRLTYNSKCHD